MTITVDEKTKHLFPASIRRRARIKTGDRFEIEVKAGIVSFIPQPPDEPDEYTAGERRTIDARLAKAEEDLRAGRKFGPFETAEAMRLSMQAEMKKRVAAKPAKRRR